MLANPYREAGRPYITEEQIWLELDRALSYAFGDPSLAYMLAGWVWSDARAAGVTDAVDAASALMSILADTA